MKQFLLVAGLLLGSCYGLMAKVDWYRGGTFNLINKKSKACPRICQNNGGTWTGSAQNANDAHGSFGLCECNVADDEVSV